MIAILKPLLPLLVAALLVSACSGDDDGNENAAPGVNHEATVAAGATEVARQILATSNPTTAPGQELVLSRVLVPAGDVLAPHTHPGVQMAVISEGVLTYRVITEQVTVVRAAGSSGARNETVAAGTTTQLRAGDVVIESPGMQHTAQNDGTTPVVIYLSSLFPAGAPASSPAP